MEESFVLSQGNVAEIIVQRCKAKNITATITVHVTSINLFVLKTQSSRDSAPRVRYLFNPPTEIGPATSHSELLTAIDVLFKQKDMAVCYGMRGAGKSSAAIAYVIEHIEDYDHIFWFSAESEKNLDVNFRALAENMALMEKDDRSTDAIKLKRGWTEAHTNSLLVFDNAPNYSVIEKYLPRLNAKVLVTSISTQWPDIGSGIKFTPVDMSDEKFNLACERWAEDVEQIRQASPRAIDLLKKCAQEEGPVISRNVLGDPRDIPFIEALGLLIRCSLLDEVNTEAVYMHLLLKRFMSMNYERKVKQAEPLKKLGVFRERKNYVEVEAVVENFMGECISAKALSGNSRVSNSVTTGEIDVASAKPEAFPTRKRDLPLESDSLGLRFNDGGEAVRVQAIDSQADQVALTGWIETESISLKLVKNARDIPEYSLPLEPELPIKDPDVINKLIFRQDVVKKIEEDFKSQHVVVCSGIRGTGKSIVAQQFVMKFRRENPDIGVFWFYPELFDLFLRNPTRIGLVIFDNARDYEAIRAYLDKMPAGIRILITSSFTQWPNCIAPVLVNVFTSEQSISYIKNRGIKFTDEAELLNLINEFGGVPLALGQVCSYISANMAGGGVKKFLECYKKDPARMILVGLATKRPHGYRGELIHSLWDNDLKMIGFSNTNLLTHYSLLPSLNPLLEKIFNWKREKVVDLEKSVLCKK